MRVHACIFTTTLYILDAVVLCSMQRRHHVLQGHHAQSPFTQLYKTISVCASKYHHAVQADREREHLVLFFDESKLLASTVPCPNIYPAIFDLDCFEGL